MANLFAASWVDHARIVIRSTFYGICVKVRGNCSAVNSPTTLFLMSPFGELLAKLARADVRYVLVGGGAVLLHGHARTTGDLDILVEASEDNARRLLHVLEEWGEGAGKELTVEDLAYPQMGCLRIMEEFPLDVFTEMLVRQTGKTLVYADVLADAQRKSIGAGIVVPYASIDRLLDLKAGTGRAKDITDVEILTEIARGAREKTEVDLTSIEPDSNENPSDCEQGEWPAS